MNRPEKGDYINIHDHGAVIAEGIFTVDNVMVHEGRTPSMMHGITYSVGAHPWHINEMNFESQMAKVRDYAVHENVIALGESGYDHLKGAGEEIQKRAFREHVAISEEMGKPLFIHCVRAYDTILAEAKNLKPSVPWILHGFNGKKALAAQLTGKGIYLSAWVEWAIRPVSSETLKSIPSNMLFLETDGFDISIIPVYNVVAGHLGIESEELREILYGNYRRIFG
jgi:TatD DNase family protein